MAPNGIKQFNDTLNYNTQTQLLNYGSHKIEESTSRRSKTPNSMFVKSASSGHDFDMKENADMASTIQNRAYVKQCKLTMTAGNPDNFLRSTTSFAMNKTHNDKLWDTDSHDRFLSTTTLEQNPILNIDYKTKAKDKENLKNKIVYDRINRAQSEMLERVREKNEAAADRDEQSRKVKHDRTMKYFDFCRERQLKEESLVDRKFRKGYGQFYILPTYSNAPLNDLPEGYETFYKSYFYYNSPILF